MVKHLGLVCKVKWTRKEQEFCDGEEWEGTNKEMVDGICLVPAESTECHSFIELAGSWKTRVTREKPGELRRDQIIKA